MLRSYSLWTSQTPAALTPPEVPGAGSCVESHIGVRSVTS